MTIPSPWPHLLASNRVPQASETQAIRQAIVEADRKMAELVKIAGPLPATEKEPYHKQISDFIDFVDTHKGVVSPVRVLPPELLSEIFIHVVPPPNLDNVKKSYWTQPHPISQPYTISQVSHSWREVALSIPSIWANIPHLGSMDIYGISDLRLLRLMMHLERSHQSPLHLSIKGTRYSAFAPAETYPVLNLLLLHCERWSSLCILVCHRYLQYLSSGCKGRLFALTDLCLAPPGASPGNHEHYDVFLGAPGLRNLYSFSSSSSWPESNLPSRSPSIFHGQKTLRLANRWVARLRCKIPMVPLNISFPDLEHLELNLPASFMPEFCLSHLNASVDYFRHLTFLRLGGDEIDLFAFRAILVLAPMVSTLELVEFPSESLVALSMDQSSDPAEPKYLRELQSLIIILPLGTSGCRESAPVLKDIVRIRDGQPPGFQIRCTFRTHNTCSIVFMGLEDIQDRLAEDVDPTIQHEFRRLRNWCLHLGKVFFGVIRPVEGISVSVSATKTVYASLTIVFARLPRGWLTSEGFVTRYEIANT